MIVDAHTHVWLVASEKYPWQPVGGYIPTSEASVSQLLERMDLAGVERAVLVQPTPYGWNNDYLLAAVRSYPHQLKSVCLVDPCSPESPERLARMVRLQGVNGVRFNWNLDNSHAWTTDTIHARIWSAAEDLGIPVCLQLNWLQLDQAVEVAGRYPHIPVILDHLGRPEPGSGVDSPAFQQFLALADLPNCFAKLSGLYYFSQQQAPFHDAWPLLSATVKAFGASRCLWGSDFPFIQEHWSYSSWLDTLLGELEFNSEELDFILGRTALGLWW